MAHVSRSHNRQSFGNGSRASATQTLPQRADQPKKQEQDGTAAITSDTQQPEEGRRRARNSDVDFCERRLKVLLEHFDEVSVACPVITEIKDAGHDAGRSVKDLPWLNRIKFIQLPNAYDLSSYVRNYQRVRRILKSEIENADYLVFSPHTLVGDWPTVAIREAIKLRRPYVLEADIVYDDFGIAQLGWAGKPFWTRLIKKDLILPLFRRTYRYCVAHASMTLLQGQDTYDSYSPFARNPQKISSNIALYKHDHVTESQLRNKLEGLDQGRPLRLCYVGRAIDMKGPMEWLEAVHELIKRGVKIKAVWLGDGSLLASMRTMVERLGITEYVSLPGFVSEQMKKETLLNSDIFLFCHKTREAPRSLGEALSSGCPLIGYDGAYPRDLIAQCGGGQFATVGDWRQLASIVQNLDKNRGELRKLIRAASVWGDSYDWHIHLQRRAALIKSSISHAAH